MEKLDISAVCPPWAEEALGNVLDAYRNHFDIVLGPELRGKTFAAMASFHSRGEKYVLVRKARLWAVECNEHVLFFTLPRFTMQDFEMITELLRESEQELVKPHPEHMYTWLSAIIITQEAEPEALSRLKRFRFRRNYRFSLHGWSQIRLAALTMEGCVTANYDGKELRKTLTKILHQTRQGFVRL